MKITDDRRKETVLFRDIDVTGLFEDLHNEGAIYMRLNPIVILDGMIPRNAVNVETGRYANFDGDEDVIPVHGEFYRKG